MIYFNENHGNILPAGRLSDVMKTPSYRKPDIADQARQLLSSLSNQQRKVLLAGLMLLFFMVGSTTLLLAYMVFQPQIASILVGEATLPNPNQETQPVLPAQMTLTGQTSSCSGATLKIGSVSLPFDSLQIGSSGSVEAPPNNPARAYWIKNLANNDVFILSPTQENLDLLASLSAGATASITWENCNTSTYTLLSPQAGEPGLDILLDLKPIGLVIYVPASDLSAGVTVEGSLTGEIIASPPTSAPSDENAEVSLVGTNTSADDQSIQVQVSILNYGDSPITFSETDISLVADDATVIALSSADPQLPQIIQPNETKTFSLVFARPKTSTALLTIFSIQYDLENY